MSQSAPPPPHAQIEPLSPTGGLFRGLVQDVCSFVLLSIPKQALEVVESVSLN